MEQISACFDNDGRCEHESSIFDPVDIAGDLYISKQPNDIKQLRHIFHRDDRLHVIYLVRDPRSVITSKRREAANQYFCNYRIWRECEEAATFYEGHSRFLRLRYEDLVADPDGQQVRIQEKFAFLRQQRLFSEFHRFARPSNAAQQALSGLRPVDQGSLAKWRQHLPRIADQYRHHPELADDLVRLGYEQDRGWLKALDDVRAIEYPCRYPEQRQRLKEWEKSLRVYLKSRRYLKRLG